MTTMTDEELGAEHGHSRGGTRGTTNGANGSAMHVARVGPGRDTVHVACRLRITLWRHDGRSGTDGPIRFAACRPVARSPHPVAAGFIPGSCPLTVLPVLASASPCPIPSPQPRPPRRPPTPDSASAPADPTPPASRDRREAVSAPEARPPPAAFHRRIHQGDAGVGGHRVHPHIYLPGLRHGGLCDPHRLHGSHPAGPARPHPVVPSAATDSTSTNPAPLDPAPHRAGPLPHVLLPRDGA